MFLFFDGWRKEIGALKCRENGEFFLTSNDAVEVYILFDDFFFKNFSRLVFSVMNMFSFALQGFWVFCSDVPSTSNTFARRFWAFKNFQSKKLEVSGSYLQACKKWNSCFLRFFKLAKTEIHVFWGFLSLQKLKFMFFEFF